MAEKQSIWNIRGPKFNSPAAGRILDAWILSQSTFAILELIRTIEPIYGCWKDVPGFTAERLEKDHATYCGEITMVDTWLGYLLRRVENMGLMENTAISGRVFTVSSIPFANPGDPVRSVDNFLRMLKAPTVTTITSENYSLLYSPEAGHSKLYDLSQDPGQHKDIIADQLDVARELHQYLVKLMRQTHVADYLLRPRLELRI